jgi:hypothetical protein
VFGRLGIASYHTVVQIKRNDLDFAWELVIGVCSSLHRGLMNG